MAQWNCIVAVISHIGMQKQSMTQNGLRGSCCLAQGTQLVLCEDLEGWDWWGRREAQERIDVCIHIAYSRCCTSRN